MSNIGDHTFKILVTGPFAAGKTSLIQSISQSPVVTTEVETTGDEAEVKALTTVAMDFGTFALDGLEEGEETINLLMFGTPGQDRFRFMTEILKADVDVVTFVINAEAPDSFAEGREMLALVMNGLEAPIVIAVNRCEDVERARGVADELGAHPSVQVIPCQLVDPASGREVIAEVLLALLQSTDLELTSHGGLR